MKTTVIFRLDNTVDTTKSEAVEIPDWARAASLFVPDIGAGAVTMEFMHNDDATAALLLASNDTSWNPVQTAIDSIDVLEEVMPTGDDPTWIGITPFIHGLGDGYIRLVTAGAQGAVINFKIVFSD